MLSRNSLIDDVRRRAVDTGYQLTETDDGFRLERDISDMTWWGRPPRAGSRSWWRTACGSTRLTGG
ncbi:MAG: hypothetical protein JWR27_1175 [Aeromicrobium sp.]|nr:hypothetical protein [Aeromicrobium sp.]